MMTASDRERDEADPGHADQAFAPADASFVCELFDALAREDRESYEELLASNDDLREKYQHLADVYADLREVCSEGPDLIREKYPEAMAEVDANLGKDADRSHTAEGEQAKAPYETGPLTRMAHRLDPHDLREFYELIAHKLVSELLELAGGPVRAEDRIKAAFHLCHSDVLARLKATAKKRESVRDALIAEIADVLNEPNLPTRVTRNDLQIILDRDDFVDRFYGFEACVERLAGARSAI